MLVCDDELWFLHLVTQPNAKSGIAVFDNVSFGGVSCRQFVDGVGLFGSGWSPRVGWLLAWVGFDHLAYYHLDGAGFGCLSCC